MSLLRILVIAALASCTPPPDGPGPDPWHWPDGEGGAVIHRGVNLNNTAKRAPEYHHGLDAETLALLPAHGVTLVRHLVFWEAIEPQEGVWDDAYLARVRADLDDLDALGLQVVLDLHQDVYGQGFGFTGFPGWTCSQEAYDAFVRADGPWFLNYTDENVVGCFDAFWASADLQEAYADMAAHLAATVGDHPAVVGLDVINEPYWGSLDIHTHDEQVLPAFYARVVEAVRAVDPTLRLFLAPSVAVNLTTEPRLDLSAFDDRFLGFSPHFYPTYSEMGTGFDGDFTDEAAALSRLADHARDQGVPLFLGEYGIFSDLGNEDDYVRGVLGAVEAAGGSTASWSFDPGRGLLSADLTAGPQLVVLGEPYVHRVPGRMISVEGTTARFELVGEGTVEWVAAGCEVEAEGAEVLDMSDTGGRVRARIAAEGEVAVGLRCAVSR